ncbi:MAG: GNAT family N-acetyltransferase [Chitinophagaceae bacterium]|jgi:GNAT superfamily N-acetyltransferase|nr:GNAT family N-acetyltransferase [Chitinophagaceae bacterium]
MSDFIIRECTHEDMGLVLSFIKELAVYEKMIDEVVVTEDLLYDQLLVKKLSACVLAFEDNVPVGFALYFFNFSTFLGKNGLYLEDLFVRPAFRGKGYGKKLLFHLADIAKQRNCGRMEWSVLNWNTPAIDFYKSIGAKAMDGWTVFRLDIK